MPSNSIRKGRSMAVESSGEERVTRPIVFLRRHVDFLRTLARAMSHEAMAAVSVSCVFRALVWTLETRRADILRLCSESRPLRRPKNGNRKAEKCFDERIARILLTAMQRRRRPAASRFKKHRILEAAFLKKSSLEAKPITLPPKPSARTE